MPGRKAGFGVAGAEPPVREDVVDLGQVVGGEGEVGGGDVLFDAGSAAGAGDGHDVVALGEQPRQR